MVWGSVAAGQADESDGMPPRAQGMSGCDDVSETSSSTVTSLLQGASRAGLKDTPARRRHARPRLLQADQAQELFAELVLERPGILSGYRVHFTPRQCLSSWLYTHNELVNIWSHLVGAGGAFALLVFTVCNGLDAGGRDLRLTMLDRAVVAAYILGAAFCMGASVTYHTFLCCSREVYLCCKRLDYSGVLGLLVTSDLPMVYFGFYHHPRLCILYLSLVAACTTGVACVAMSGKRAGMKFNRLRHVLFVALVAVGWTHMVHEVALKGGLATSEGRASLKCWVSAFGLYGVGFGFFVTKLPERLWPGRFDTWGHSHQLWHLFIIAGAWVHFCNVVVYIKIAKGLPLA